MTLSFALLCPFLSHRQSDILLFSKKLADLLVLLFHLLFFLFHLLLQSQQIEPRTKAFVTCRFFPLKGTIDRSLGARTDLIERFADNKISFPRLRAQFMGTYSISKP